MLPPVETPYLRPAFLTAVLGALLSLAVSALLVAISRGSADTALPSFVRSTVRTWLVSLGSGVEVGAVSF
ncbi:MAG: hypothetical protein JWP31_1865, partial [Aeromicrobium sp.]|nr:hypothetical protein [Aeromicrobium sp.]